MEKKARKIIRQASRAGDGTREERLLRKNLEECERSRGTTASTLRASFCSICSKAKKIATYGGNDVFGRIILMVVWDQNGYATCVPIDSYVCMCFHACACFYGATYGSWAGSRPNTFLVSTVRQLVCGSSRNLNPMILGTDPSRVPNLRRGLPLALKAAAEERERTANEKASAGSARGFLLDDKPLSSHKGTVGS